MNKIKYAFSLARRAVAGEQANITSGSIDKAIVMLAVPMILELAMESLFAVVDIFFVSRIGIDAVAVVAPNHWHTLASIWAIQAGKHVTVEKQVVQTGEPTLLRVVQSF